MYNKLDYNEAVCLINCIPYFHRSLNHINFI